MKYFFSKDQSGHNYLVESSHRKEWSYWLHLDQDDELSWEQPPFATRIDSISAYDFENPVYLAAKFLDE